MPDMFAMAKEGERWHLLECSRTMNHVNSERLFTGTLDEVYGFLLANTGAAENNPRGGDDMKFAIHIFIEMLRIFAIIAFSAMACTSGLY